MRREIFRSSRDTALALLARAPLVHVAGVDDEGRPVLRSLHGVIVGDRICFHAAPAGEKTLLVGKRVVVQAEEIVAEIPSTFTDPERACPATTLYESAQVHGVLERVDDVDARAAVLQALMERFQPEGGYRPITAGDPMYASAVKGILVMGVSLADLDGKSKLAQNKKPEEVTRIVEQLWRRGRAGDARAVDRVLDANPAAPRPAFLEAPEGARFRVALEGDDARFLEEAIDMLLPTYWNVGVSRDQLARAHLSSQAWVGAVDDDERLVASARALSDGAKWATIYDVVVREDWRGKGVGTAMVRLLLDHPAVRGAKKITLRTKDAQGVYAKLGFTTRPASTSEEMALVRP
jgi:GNAT superfamily N-acetyltransferase/nitroimidazol reductase NimA-like FMN-containing flavoprotein (pyridoxamine 5'-phosphate oxidase superfamily)